MLRVVEGVNVRCHFRGAEAAREEGQRWVATLEAAAEAGGKASTGVRTSSSVLHVCADEHCAIGRDPHSLWPTNVFRRVVDVIHRVWR